MTSETLTHRLAHRDDLDALRALMDAAISKLQKPFLDESQIASSRTIMGLDTQLIDDATYFIVEAEDGSLAGCGGWSKRKTLFGGDQYSSRNTAYIDPETEPAKIRAFFIHPDHARKGVARALLSRCEDEARAQGYRALELLSTLPGIEFYKSCRFVETGTLTLDLTDSVKLDFVPMRKEL